MWKNNLLDDAAAATQCDSHSSAGVSFQQDLGFIRLRPAAPFPLQLQHANVTPDATTECECDWQYLLHSAMKYLVIGWHTWRGSQRRRTGAGKLHPLLNTPAALHLLIYFFIVHMQLSQKCTCKYCYQKRVLRQNYKDGLVVSWLYKRVTLYYADLPFRCLLIQWLHAAAVCECVCVIGKLISERPDNWWPVWEAAPIREYVQLFSPTATLEVPYPHGCYRVKHARTPLNASWLASF